MQRYVYANGEKRGYALKTTMPEFFEKKERLDKLMQLFMYDFPANTTLFAEKEPATFWGLVTDLEQRNEPERLYLQQNGPDLYGKMTNAPDNAQNIADDKRLSFYAKGYISEAADRTVFQEDFLERLKTDFQSSQQTLENWQTPLAEQENWQTISSIKPAAISSVLLTTILRVLFAKKRVLIRIDKAGDASLYRFREVLLAIYQSLPFAYRKDCGFVAGATEKRLCGEEKYSLPGSILCCLVGADADMAYLHKRFRGVIVDLVEGTTSIAQGGQSEDAERFLSFLAEEIQENRDEFFCFAQNLLGNAVASFSDYVIIFANCYQVSKQNPRTKGLIDQWAFQQYGVAKKDKIRDLCFDAIRDALSVEDMQWYIGSKIVANTLLAPWILGCCDDAKKVAQINTYKNSNSADDSTTYFGMILFENIFNMRGEQGEKERQKFINSVVSICEAVANQSVSEQEDILDAKVYFEHWKTQATLFFPIKASMACPLAYDIYQSFVTRQRQRYAVVFENELKKQRDSAVRVIRTHFNETVFETQDVSEPQKTVDKMVRMICECSFLCETLLKEEGDGSWKNTLGDCYYCACMASKINDIDQMRVFVRAQAELDRWIRSKDNPLQVQLSFAEERGISAKMQLCQKLLEIEDNQKQVKSFTSVCQNAYIQEFTMQQATISQTIYQTQRSDFLALNPSFSIEDICEGLQSETWKNLQAVIAQNKQWATNTWLFKIILQQNFLEQLKICAFEDLAKKEQTLCGIYDCFHQKEEIEKIKKLVSKRNANKQEDEQRCAQAAFYKSVNKQLQAYKIQNKLVLVLGLVLILMVGLTIAIAGILLQITLFAFSIFSIVLNAASCSVIYFVAKYNQNKQVGAIWSLGYILVMIANIIWLLTMV